MMKTNQNNSQRRREQVSATKANVIKLGLDVHATEIVVVRQVDGATPQPAQKFEWAAFLKWAAKQLEAAERVCSCYEAGPFGYGLHRQLEALGIKNVVVRPKAQDPYGKRVKTDKGDALGLVGDLDRWLAGNEKAFSVVRVPSEEEEQRRSWSRLREQFRRERQRLESRGRSLMLYYGIGCKGPWWKPRLWEKLRKQLNGFLIELLEELRPILMALEEKVQAHTRKLEASAPSDRPVGFGKLTCATIEREVTNWKRFSNRRQVSSYTGLCPGEHSSGAQRFQGPINKHGNPRLRHLLIELAWRVVRFQPGYHALIRWRTVLRHSAAAARKKAIVAIARRLAIDLWRVKTGRTGYTELGLVLAKT